MLDRLKPRPGAAAQNSDKALMSGPQLSKDAPSQDDIDKLFAQS